MKIGRAYSVGILLSCALGQTLTGDTISFSGSITQSTGDGTGPASNNSALNDISDSQSYTVTLVFPGSITAAGTFPLPGASLLFDDPSAPATESSFDSLSLSVATDGASYDLSLLGCLSTGSGCLLGNELDANFQIPLAGLNAPNVSAQPIFGLVPLDLLEDDGVTDIHGSVTNYSYIPEPSQIGPLSLILALLALLHLRSRPGMTGKGRQQ